MTQVHRREFLIGASSLAAVTACSGSGSAADPATPTTTLTATTGAPAPTTTAAVAPEFLVDPGSVGLVDEAFFQGRVDEYLSFASATPRLNSAPGVAVQLARARRDPAYEWDIAGVTVDGFAHRWTQLDEWRDTRDFQFMYFNWILAYGQGDTAMTQVDPSVIDAITERVLANRYRYNDPLPDDRIDHLWYWSENHRIITLANEHMAGQFFPHDVFAVTGMTGADQGARARPEILEWVHERGRFGFFEWHSNVYMAKNVSPLLMLCELSNDPEIVQAASRALDLCLFDMASHYHRGAYTAPHGRTYKKDKMTARDEDSFDLAKLLFDRTPGDFVSTDSTTATYFCLAERYRPPQLIIDVARDDSISVTRERHGIHVDSQEPISNTPEAPFGYDFKDPANLPFWWSTGGIGLWQIAEVSTAEADAHRLWDGDVFTQIKQLADIQDRDVEKIEEWVRTNYMILNLGHLDEANTYAWRSPQVSLASVVDHRKGQMRDQVHIWQATINPDARVFTTHPMTGPPESTEWRDDDIPGYWTGEASMPRSAQFERTAIHIYSPLYDVTTDPLLGLAFPYRDYTHAYFPQDHFDEVTQVGSWTLGAKDGGYVALWSRRPPTWRIYDPEVHATDGMVEPFDLIAEGGPDNVWIVEVGTEDDGTFAEFVAAVTAIEPVESGAGDTQAVSWTSPTAGAVSFGWQEPFVVGGEEQLIADFPRHESPWGTVERLDLHHRWQLGDAVLDIDFDAGTRIVEA